MDMTRLPSLLAAVAAVTLALPGAAVLAQDQGRAEQAAPVTQDAAAAEVQQQQAANKAMADFAKQQVADNEARIAAYQQAQATYEAELARVEAERKARDAVMAKASSDHEAAVAKWRADIAACKEGDKTHCPPSTEPEPTGLKRLLSKLPI
jgi:hypothetical protein